MFQLHDAITSKENKYMKESKEQYWKWSLIAIVGVLGVIIIYEALPFLSGVLGAFTLYLLVRKQMVYLKETRKLRQSVAATIILAEVVLCILIPTFLVLWLLLNRVQSYDLHPGVLITTIHDLVYKLQERTGYNLLSTDNISAMTAYISQGAQMIVSGASSFIVNCLVLLFVLYFMLIGGRKMEAYIYDILPFSETNKKKIINETHIIVRSNAIGIPLLAIIQGAIAAMGYFIFGAPSPILFGLITCFATIIPLLGTALVWFPLALYLYLSGSPASGIGLAIYALVVISNVDNVIRFLLQKKLADTHPLITIFGVVIGLTLFGFWGVIFGPLLVSLFILCFDLLKKDYIDPPSPHK